MYLYVILDKKVVLNTTFLTSNRYILFFLPRRNQFLIFVKRV